MGNRLWALASVGALLVACGGGHTSSTPPPPPPSGGGGTGGGGSVAAPGPTAPSGPTGPTGSDISGNATPPATQPTPGAPPAASPPPSAPGATAPSACDGLLPDAPGAGVAYDLATGSSMPNCDDPVTDGHGDWIGLGESYKTFSYRFTGATAPGPLVGNLSAPDPFDGEEVVAPQPDGYHVAHRMTGDWPGSFQRYDTTGNLLSDDGARDVFGVTGLPGGGSVADVAAGYTPTGTTQAVPHVVWRNAAGDVLADLAGASPIAVSSTADVLVASGGNLRWYDRSGAAVGDPFPNPVDMAAAARQLNHRADHPLALADGSVVLFLGTDQAVRIAARATSASQVPDWVKARAGAVFANVRGGHANAFARVTSAQGAACEIALEILTAAGESCGTTQLRSPKPCDRVSIGADCSVFATGGSTDASGVVCSWRWWSGLLR